MKKAMQQNIEETGTRFENEFEVRIRKLDFGDESKNIINKISKLPDDSNHKLVLKPDYESEIFSLYFEIGGEECGKGLGTPEFKKGSKDLRERIIEKLKNGDAGTANYGENSLYADSCMANWHEVPSDQLHDLFNSDDEDIDSYLFMPQVVKTLKKILNENSEINNVSILMGISYGRLNPKEVLFNPLLRLSLPPGEKFELSGELDLGGFEFDTIFYKKGNSIVQQSVFTLNWPWPCPPCIPPK